MMARKQNTQSELQPRSLHELRNAVAATKTRFDAEDAEVVRLEARRANPEPDDTPASLAAIDKEIADARARRDIAKANHDRAKGALERAEQQAAADSLASESEEAKRLTQEMARTLPGEMKRRSLALIAGATEMENLSLRISALNVRRVAVGLEPLPLPEDLMRTIPAQPAGDVKEVLQEVGPTKIPEKRKILATERPAIRPTRFAMVLKIPGFGAGEPTLRVPGVPEHPGIWIDAQGFPQR